MSEELPEYYFRIRDNGAAVFRVSNDPRLRRIDLEPIANVNIKNGEIKPQGDRILSETDLAQIRAWAQARTALMLERDIDDILRTVDHLNLTTQWVQAKATDEQIDRVGDALLMAMHDLRGVLARRKAEQMQRSQTAPAEETP